MKTREIDSFGGRDLRGIVLVLCEDFSQLENGRMDISDYLRIFITMGGRVVDQSSQGKNSKGVLSEKSIIRLVKKRKSGESPLRSSSTKAGPPVYSVDDFIEYIERVRLLKLKDLYKVAIKEEVRISQLCYCSPLWIFVVVSDIFSWDMSKKSSPSIGDYKELNFFKEEVPLVFQMKFFLNALTQKPELWPTFFDNCNKVLFRMLSYIQGTEVVQTVTATITQTIVSIIKRFFFYFSSEIDNSNELYFCSKPRFCKEQGTMEYQCLEWQPDDVVSFVLRGDKIPVFVHYSVKNSSVSNINHHPVLLSVAKFMHLCVRKYKEVFEKSSGAYHLNCLVTNRNKVFWLKLSCTKNGAVDVTSDRINLPRSPVDIELEKIQHQQTMTGLINSVLNSVCFSVEALTSETPKHKQYTLMDFQKSVQKLVKERYGVGFSAKFFKVQNKFSLKFTFSMFETNMSVIFLGKKSYFSDSEGRNLEEDVIIKVCPDNIYSLREKKILTEMKSVLKKYIPRCDFFQIAGYNFFILERLNHLNAKTLSFEDRFELMIQMTKIVQHFHRNHILLNDLKRDHFMRSNDGKLKIIDFNLSLFFQKEIFNEKSKQEYLLDKFSNQFLKDRQGTSIFMPSEKKEDGDGFLSKKTDVYCLGLIFLQLMMDYDGSHMNPMELFRTFLKFKENVLEKKRDFSKVQIAQKFGRKKLKRMDEVILYNFFDLIANMTKFKKEERLSTEKTIEKLMLMKSEAVKFDTRMERTFSSEYLYAAATSCLEEEIEEFDVMDYH